MRNRGHLRIWELQLVLLFLVVTPKDSAGACDPGYINGSKGKCTDEDECLTDYEDEPGICGENAKCFNTEGSYYCQCESGFISTKGNVNFTGESVDRCQDIDECKVEETDCGLHATCQNNMGSYACVCEDGFVTSNGKETFLVDDRVTCKDIDECTVEEIDCGPNATCQNNIGGYACVCKSGFVTSNGKETFSAGQGVTCQDICNMEPSICGGGTCYHGHNGSECLCHEGYTNYGSTQEACTALNCDRLLDDITYDHTPPELETLLFLLKTQCLRLTGASVPEEALDGEALLTKLLSLLDDLLSKGPLRDNKQVTILLSSVERALKLLGPLLNDNQTIRSTNYVDVELLVRRGDSAPTGNVSLFSGHVQMDTHWETATGAAFSRFSTAAFLTYKNLENSTNGYFKVNPDEENQTFQVNSKVVTATVSNMNTTQLTKNITLSFLHLSSMKEQHKCVYWDLEFKGWSDHGCTVVKSNASHTVCSCNHLSSFAVLMALYEIEDTIELLMMTWVGLSLSVVCLLACILTFAFCRSIQSTRNTIHLHLSLSLFIATIIFLAGISRTENQTGCAVVAGLLHFFYLATFCWMCLEGVQLFRMVVLVFNTTLRPLYMMAAGYGVPAFIVTISALVNAKEYGSKRHCWFDVKKISFIWSFFGPVCVVITVNVFFFLVTVYKLAEKFSSLNPDLNNLRKIKTFVVTAVAQLAVLGTMWIFGCFQFNKSTMAASYIFTFLNCLQGVLMFFMHCLLNKQVREDYGNFLSCICSPHKTKHSDYSSNQSKSQMSKSAQNTGESQI